MLNIKGEFYTFCRCTSAIEDAVIQVKNNSIGEHGHNSASISNDCAG